MNTIKSKFSIKDLENLSGIKAHTIRIWEKRYKLFSPNRTETNIRYYTTESLLKLLNVTLLYNNGFKISKISSLDSETIKSEARNIISEKAVKNLFINDMKLAMMNFDQALFENSYQKLIAVLDFKEIYISYFIPFLQEIGLLWHTDTINLTHEHFITSLIKQKILVNIEKSQVPPTKHDRRFVLFLPTNEIHDLGLTYINYELLCRGYSSIYLGPSVPIDSLIPFTSFDEKVVFISYFTVQPSIDKIPDYINELYREVISKCNGELWVTGRKIIGLDDCDYPDSVKFIEIQTVIETINACESQPV